VIRTKKHLRTFEFDVDGAVDGVVAVADERGQEDAVLLRNQRFRQPQDRAKVDQTYF
jgi:hypothetical protein